MYHSLEALEELSVKAAKKGWLRTMEIVLGRGVSPNHRDDQDYPIMCISAAFAFFGTTLAVYEAGGDVNIQDPDGNSPIMNLLRSSTGHPDESKLFAALWERGADLDLVNNEGHSGRQLASASSEHILQVYDEILAREAAAKRGGMRVSRGRLATYVF